jgi:hypothetical protein
MARQTIRVLQFVRQAPSVRLSPFGGKDADDQILLVAERAGASPRQLLSTKALLHQLQSADLIAIRDQSCRLTSGGRGHLRRHASGFPPAQENAFAGQHRQTVNDTVSLNGERQNVRRNLHESPLSRLKTQRSKDGSPWLSDAAFNAGERLRRDFTCAQLMPSVTSNWNAAMGGGQRRDGQGGKVELSDGALDARQRFNEALAFVGPDLCDVLIDICCYLKGLQQVEQEQGWPPRSAKLMLRTGLGLLAQFYGTQPGTAARRGEHAPMRVDY